jgi:hypothetical protein
MKLDTTQTDREHLPTSAALAAMLADLPGETASIGFLVGRLGERSFGLLLLVLAVMGLAPGIATATTTLMPIIAIQMVLGYHSPVLPGFLAARAVSSARFSRAIARLVPPFRYAEIFVRPRLTLPRAFATRFVGVLVLIRVSRRRRRVPGHCSRGNCGVVRVHGGKHSGAREGSGICRETVGENLRGQHCVPIGGP